MNKQTKRKKNGSIDPKDASLEQIREILYGAQARETDEQFDQLHQRLNESLKALRTQLAKQITDLDARNKEETASLKAALRAERAERSEAVQELSGELAESVESLQQSISDLGERLDKSIAQTREILMSKLNAASGEWSNRHDELSAVVEEEFEDIRTITADRAELSDLFRELGQRINGELKKPAPKG